MIRIPCLTVSTLLFTFSIVGCASFDVPEPEGPSTVDVSRTAVRCLCIWRSVDSEDAAGQPVRGFGGQVFFFAADSEKPVAVDGDVRVYLFDDVGTPAQQARPKDVQDYDPLVWKSLMTTSQVGTNYTLFVPYQQTSKYESICSLRLRLVRPDGTQLFSNMATVKLNGEPRPDQSVRQIARPSEHSIRQDRSRELHVDRDLHSDSNGRAATIGSIQEGDLSLSDEYRVGNHAGRHAPVSGQAVSDQTADHHASLRIQRYEAKLAEMHDAFETDTDRRRQPTRDPNQELLDLMPAIREVSQENRKAQRRVTPAAHEVFSAEESPRYERVPVYEEHSPSADRASTFPRYESRRTDSRRSGSMIRSFSRPLSRDSKSKSVPERFEEDHVQALQLARITDQ